MDEAARQPYDSFVSLLTTVTQTRGWGIIISTPKGRGWFYDVYQRGEKFDEEGRPRFEAGEDKYPEWFSIRMPTWANPHVPKESIAEMKNNLPEDVFRQEVAAEFLMDSAGVFRGIRECIKGTFQDPQRGHQYTLGVDLGRLKDFTVTFVIDNHNRHIVYFDRFNQLSWEVQRHRIVELGKRYHANVVIDSTGIGDPIVEDIQNSGVRVTPYKIGGTAAKQQLIDKLRVNIERQAISFPFIPALKRELESYEYEVSDRGTIKYSAPQGQHDDCVIALSLANWGAEVDPFVYRYKSQRGI